MGVGGIRAGAGCCSRCVLGAGGKVALCVGWVVIFYQAEDGIRYRDVTGVQTCALPIFLEKLQIHRIGRKDLVDLLVTFLGHDVKEKANGDREAVDAGHIANLLADDWGFWYESMQNLEKTRQMLAQFIGEGRISQDLAQRIRSRITELESKLQSVPKGRHWERRAKVGTAKPWVDRKSTRLNYSHITN